MTLSPEQRARIQAEQAQLNTEAARQPVPAAATTRLARSLSSINRLSVADWRSGLARRGNRILGDERNMLLTLRLAPELRGLVRFNEFALRVELTRPPPWRDAQTGDPWTDDDDLSMQAWAQEREIEVRQRGIVADSVAAVAKDITFHPVRDYFNQLEWDRRPRLDDWLADLLHAEGPPPYLQAVGRRFLISIVARVVQPGAKVDHMLVLEGEQGIGKSSIARLMAVKPEWFCDDMPDLHSKDSALQLSGKLVIELAELAAIRRSSELESIKAFITRASDTYRPPYARRTVNVPRQAVFVASTNESEYLRDRSGNRRFWPVRIPRRVDLQRFEQHRDQLFAEAVHRFRAGEQWHLTDEEATLAASEQHERLLVTVLESDVGEYLLRMESQGHAEVSMKQVLVDAVGLDSQASDFAERAGRLGPQVASALDRAGWRKVGPVGRGVNRRMIYRKA